MIHVWELFIWPLQILSLFTTDLHRYKVTSHAVHCNMRIQGHVLQTSVCSASLCTEQVNITDHLLGGDATVDLRAPLIYLWIQIQVVSPLSLSIWQQDLLLAC